jgi:hypothetical protein
MPTHPKAAPKSQQKQKQLPPSSRLEKVIKNREDQGMLYEYDSHDKLEIVFTELRKRYLDTLKLSFQWMLRIKQRHPPYAEFLVYHLNETITDRDNNDHYFDSLNGVWQAIESSGKINPETGERENAKIKRVYNVFDIEYSPQKVRDLIYDKRLVLQPSKFLIGIASEDPSDIVIGRKWVVPNVEEFISHDFDTLLFAAEKGYLEKAEGGALRAKDDMLEQQQQQQPQQQQQQQQQQIPPKKK